MVSGSPMDGHDFIRSAACVIYVIASIPIFSHLVGAAKERSQHLQGGPDPPPRPRPRRSCRAVAASEGVTYHCEKKGGGWGCGVEEGGGSGLGAAPRRVATLGITVIWRYYVPLLGQLIASTTNRSA